MKITNFNELLIAARREPVPQRFLFLFAKATALKNDIKSRHSSGTITPIMCVDKTAEELTSLAALIKEADAITDKWDFVFIGCLGAHADMEPHLNKMSNDVANGNDLSRYVILDRQERPIIIA